MEITPVRVTTPSSSPVPVSTTDSEYGAYGVAGCTDLLIAFAGVQHPQSILRATAENFGEVPNPDLGHASPSSGGPVA